MKNHERVSVWAEGLYRRGGAFFHEVGTPFAPHFQGGAFCGEAYRLLKVIEYRSGLTISSNPL
jgi:hypothetical protein